MRKWLVKFIAKLIIDIKLYIKQNTSEEYHPVFNPSPEDKPKIKTRAELDHERLSRKSSVDLLTPESFEIGVKLGESLIEKAAKTKEFAKYNLAEKIKANNEKTWDDVRAEEIKNVKV